MFWLADWVVKSHILKDKLFQSEVFLVHNMKVYVEAEVQPHPILHCALDGGESSISHPQGPRQGRPLN